MKPNPEKGTHGGARPGAGRKPTPVSESRVKALLEQGMPKYKIAERLHATTRNITKIAKGLK